MYLKQIQLQGFKSFAEKTVLDFLPPQNGKQSVTAVVGPNGSGKSNVSDAIRWVMGEQSMKQLRGKKSEDIIFSGSEHRGKLGMASVSLHLDNSDQKAPIEYDELVITRRLYRSGESEYLINGATVRLVDLQLLLAKAQFAHGSYSVIGQGVIDRMLLQSPAERKNFFDEATGIKEFQIKRHQSWLKLRRTNENIEQAELLLNEVAPRLKTLSRQVKKLEQRQELEIDLRETQETYYHSLWTYYEGEHTAVKQKVAEAQKTYTAQSDALIVIQTKLAELAKAESRQDVYDALQREYQEALREKQRIQELLTQVNGKLQIEYRKSGQQSLGWLEQKIDQLKAQQKEVGDEYSALESSEQKQVDRVLELERELDAKRVEKSTLQSSVAGLEHEMAQAKGEQAYMQVVGVRAVQSLLEARADFPGIRGAVAQLGRVSQEYQMALDVAAGGHTSSIVVSDDQVASACISYLRQHQLGTATFLPINKVKGRFLPNNIDEILNRPGVHGLAIDLVEFDDELEDIFSHVFGSTVVVDDIATAREIGIGRVRMVTLEGDLLETSGAMKGGYRKRTRHGLSFADARMRAGQDTEELERECAQKRAEFEQLELHIETVRTALQDAKSQEQLAKQKRELLQEKKQQIDTEVASLTQELNLSTMDPGAADAVKKDIQKEKVQLEESLKDALELIEQKESAVRAFHQEEEEKKKEVFLLQEQMQELQTALNTIGAGKQEQEILLAKLETKMEDVEQELFQELREAPTALAARDVSTVAVESLESVYEQVQKLKYKLSLIGGIDAEVEEEYEQTRARYEDLTGQLDDLKSAMKDLEQLIGELDAVMKKKRDAAMKQIKKEFARYFSLLFDGGEAGLKEVYGEEVDEQKDEEDQDQGEEQKKKRKKKVLVGIDVFANPPGKKIQNIHSLSGGERTMTSIALVCAILHTNPSPFVVLDEVEAALDEANTLRFTKILHELAARSQFIIITHNRATMHAANALYGVTMGNEGVSKLLSVKIEQAQEMTE